MPEKCDNQCSVTIQQCPICEKEVCETYWFVHEQADDEADGVLLDSYVFLQENDLRKTLIPFIGFRGR